MLDGSLCNSSAADNITISYHYPIFTVAPINCPQNRICVKFSNHSGKNLAKLKTEVGHYLNNHVQINQDVSANTNNSCNNLFVINSKYCPIKDKEITFTRRPKPWISDAIMVSLNRKHELFRQYKNGIVTFDHYNSLKTISQLLYVMLEIIISRENSQSALIIQGTPVRL